MLLSMYSGKTYHTSNDIIISQQEKKSSSRPLVDVTFFAEESDTCFMVGVRRHALFKDITSGTCDLSEMLFLQGNVEL